MRNCPECHQPIDKICYDCGICFDEPEFVVTDLHTYIPIFKRKYCRLDHFREVLNQYQGKEGREIPEDIVQRVRDELAREPMSVKQALRDLKLTKYVENANYLEFIINSKPMPYIPKLIEDKLVRYFKVIDRTFTELYSDKQSFMSYYYVIYKLLELMGQHELMKDVPILKTRSRIRQHDKVWHAICEELGWQFQATI